MSRFQILSNNYLSRNINAFYHVPYTGYRNPENPDYLNILKNTYNSYPQDRLRSAANELRCALLNDLPQILDLSEFDVMTVCVVPRAKAEDSYHANQLLFKSTVQAAVGQMNGFTDGTNYICRYDNTRTTHLPETMSNYTNDGPMPFPGITEKTCKISPNVKGKDILLIDDIYTPGVNIDEDAINALLNAGARIVTFYAVGKV
jgi:hypothetical protein